MLKTADVVLFLFLRLENQSLKRFPFFVYVSPHCTFMPPLSCLFPLLLLMKFLLIVFKPLHMALKYDLFTSDTSFCS